MLHMKICNVIALFSIFKKCILISYLVIIFK